MRKKTQVVCHEKGGDAFYTTKKCKKGTKSKVIKIFGASGLALIMGIGTLYGVLIAPIVTAQANAHILTCEKVLTPQEKLLSGQGLGLDPKYDPIIFTTENGLDIKFGAATLTNGILSGYTYFTMGSYGGTPINWVIIGRHSSTTSGITTGNYALILMNYFNVTPYSTPVEYWVNNYYDTITPAGVAINNGPWDKRMVIVERTNYEKINITLSSNEVVNDVDLTPGSVLVLSEYIICNSKFDTSGYASGSYEVSVLKTKMTSLFESELNFTEAQKNLIIPQYLESSFYQGVSYTSSAYLFPLAYQGENFNASTYLNNSQQRIACSLSATTTVSEWWSRSGHSSYSGSAYYFGVDGDSHNDKRGVYNSLGVRPAFVLSLA